MALSEKWHKRYYELAEHVAQWSKDDSTKVGAVIVDSDTNRIISLGYNGFPRGINDDLPERHERPLKYEYAEHAERNAIYNADQSLRGTTIYVTFPPCTDCVRGIIQTGIKTVVCKRPDFGHERWGDKWKLSFEMLEEAGIEIVYLSEERESIIGDQEFYATPPTYIGYTKVSVYVPSFYVRISEVNLEGKVDSYWLTGYADEQKYAMPKSNSEHEVLYMKHSISGDIENFIEEVKQKYQNQENNEE